METNKEQQLMKIFENNEEEAFGVGITDKENRIYYKRNKYKPSATNPYDENNNVMFFPYSNATSQRIPLHCIGISFKILEEIKDIVDTIIIQLITTKEDGSKKVTFLKGTPEMWIDSRISNTLNERETKSKHGEMNNIRNDFQKMFPVSSLEVIQK